MARGMMYALRTSGAETLASAANVFMGQTEAPIIVKPYVPAMTRSELLAMMVGGMATISGGVMAVYIGLGADPIAILTTSVMAAPCGLYLAKLLLPETEEPETRGDIQLRIERRHVNVIDAAASGASDGLTLALNVAAMLIAFLAFIALVDAMLGWAWPGLTLAAIFSIVFAPVAFLMGVPAQDIPAVADLLGTKLVANEFVSFVKLTTEYQGHRSAQLHPGDLCADGICQPRLDWHSTRRHRRDGPEPARRSGAARVERAAGRVHRDAGQRLRRLDAVVECALDVSILRPGDRSRRVASRQGIWRW
jgi:nucleoside transporter